MNIRGGMGLRRPRVLAGNRKVAGSIPGSSSLGVGVSLSEAPSPSLLLTPCNIHPLNLSTTRP